MALIAVDDTGAAWVQALVYLAVAMTVISGADYFLNVRKRIDESRRRGGWRVSGDALDLVGDPLEQLVAARAAHVQRAVEGAAVEVEAGEEDVDRADGRRAAVERHVARARR